MIVQTMYHQEKDEAITYNSHINNLSLSINNIDYKKPNVTKQSSYQLFHHSLHQAQMVNRLPV
ncbi:hypothetical protein Hanom_Chr11g00986111 [Helianthus anomalus]